MADFDPDAYLASKTPSGFDPDAYLASKETKTGTLEAAGRGAANNVPLGPQIAATGEAFFGHGDYSKNLADWKAKAAQAKADHPVAYGAGAVAGTVLPALAIPADVPAAVAGAGLGALGGISDVDLKKNPGEGLKQGLEGAAIGGAAGKAGEMIADWAGGLPAKADRVRAQTLGLSNKLMGNLEPAEVEEYGNFAARHGLDGLDPEAALTKAEGASKNAGEEIGRIGAGAHPAASAPKHAMALVDKAGELENIDGAQKDVRTLLQGASNIEKTGKTFGDLQKLKTFYGDKAFDASHQVKDKAAATVYGAVKRAMQDAIDTAPEAYRDAMKEYKMAGDAVNGLTRRVGAIRNGTSGANGIGFMGRILSKLPGQSNPLINLPTAAAVGAAGHPMMGLMAATPSLNNPAVQAKVLDGLAKILPEVPKNALAAIAAKLFQEGVDNGQ